MIKNRYENFRHSERLGKYYEFTNSYFQKQNFCHSESLGKYYEPANSYFSCYSESVNADGKPSNVILNLIQDLLMPIKKRIKQDRFRIKSGMTLLREMHLYGMPQNLCSCLSGMTKNTGLLRFARNDGKIPSAFLPPLPTLSLVGRGFQ